MFFIDAKQFWDPDLYWQKRGLWKKCGLLPQCVCGRELSLNLVNPHLDECLNRQKGEKKRKKSLTTSQSDKASALQQSKRPKFNSIDSYFIKQK